MSLTNQPLGPSNFYFLFLPQMSTNARKPQANALRVPLVAIQQETTGVHVLQEESFQRTQTPAIQTFTL